MNKNRQINKEWVLYNLTEAHEQLEEIIKDIKENKDYLEGDLWGPMSHLYQHINTAWNSRYESKKKIDKSTEKDHNKWASLPKQNELLPF